MIAISGAMAACAVFIFAAVLLAIFGDEDAQNYIKDTFSGGILDVFLGCLGLIISLILIFFMVIGFVVVIL